MSNKTNKFLTKTFLAWFAGFWEGEGHISVRQCTTRKGTRTQACRFGLTQTSKVILDEIKTRFGFGEVYEFTPARVKPVFKWEVFTRAYIIDVINLILPFTKFRTMELQRKLRLIEKYFSTMKKRKWTKDDITFLKKNYAKLSDWSIGKRLNRKTEAIREMRHRLNLLHQRPLCREVYKVP